MGIRYEVAIEHRLFNPHWLYVVAYRVDGSFREVKHMIGDTTLPEVAERWAQNLRDDFNTEGSQLKRVYVTRIGVMTEVISERVDHTQRTLMQNTNNKFIENWLDNYGYIRVTCDIHANKYIDHVLCGDYIRELL